MRVCPMSVCLRISEVCVHGCTFSLAPLFCHLFCDADPSFSVLIVIFIVFIHTQVDITWVGHFANIFQNAQGFLGGIAPNSPALDAAYEERTGQPPTTLSMEVRNYTIRDLALCFVTSATMN